MRERGREGRRGLTICTGYLQRDGRKGREGSHVSSLRRLHAPEHYQLYVLSLSHSPTHHLPLSPSHLLTRHPPRSVSPTHSLISILDGVPLDANLLQEARDCMAQCDLLFVVGSSLVVQPVNTLPGICLAKQTPVVMVSILYLSVSPSLSSQLSSPSCFALPLSMFDFREILERPSMMNT